MRGRVRSEVADRFYGVVLCFGESDLEGREETPWRLAGGGACWSTTSNAAECHLLSGTDESGKQENRNGTRDAPVFLLSCFPDPLSAPCSHQSKGDSVPAALSATSNRTPFVARDGASVLAWGMV